MVCHVLPENGLQGRKPEIPPVNLDAATVMDLEGDASLALADELIVDIDHLLSVEPCLYVVSLRLDPHGVPVPVFQDILLLFRYLYEPSASV